MTALAAVTLLAAAALAACASAAPLAPAEGDAASSAPAAPGAGSGSGLLGPVVEVPFTPAPDTGAPAYLGDAHPTTALGELRARHLPVWTSDFDWAFPPEACHSAWELDGIAEPYSHADITVLGDFATAATLAVMRYEHQFSRALADPTALAQLCVAVASVEPVRSASLEVLESYLAAGSRRAEAATYPGEVVIVAANATTVVAVACVTPGYPTVVADDGEVTAAPRAPSRLQAYLLAASRGLEDTVTDISYRVSNAANQPAEDCAGLIEWATEWDSHVQDWAAQGQIWERVGAILSADSICETPPPGGPDECPRDWPL